MPDITSNYNELTVDEIIRIAAVLYAAGIKSVRLTGGEPLLRKDIAAIAAGLRRTGFEDIALTTNAALLTDALACKLKAAGISRVNIGISSINPGRYLTITGGKLQPALDGIASARKQFSEVRVNCVMVDGFDDCELESFRQFVNFFNITLRFIEYMPVFGNVRPAKFDIGAALAKLGAIPVTGVSGQGPAEYYSVPGFCRPVGLILPLHKKFCGSCRRIRLSSSGELRRCLFDNQLLNMTALLNGCCQASVIRAIESFVAGKSSEHSINEASRFGHSMAKIGG